MSSILKSVSAVFRRRSTAVAAVSPPNKDEDTAEDIDVRSEFLDRPDTPDELIYEEPLYEFLFSADEPGVRLQELMQGFNETYDGDEAHLRALDLIEYFVSQVDIMRINEETCPTKSASVDSTPTPVQSVTFASARGHPSSFVVLVATKFCDLVSVEAVRRMSSAVGIPGSSDDAVNNNNNDRGAAREDDIDAKESSARDGDAAYARRNSSRQHQKDVKKNLSRLYLAPKGKSMAPPLSERARNQLRKEFIFSLRGLYAVARWTENCRILKTHLGIEFSKLIVATLEELLTQLEVSIRSWSGMLSSKESIDTQSSLEQEEQSIEFSLLSITLLVQFLVSCALPNSDSVFTDLLPHQPWTKAELDVIGLFGPTSEEFQAIRTKDPSEVAASFYQPPVFHNPPGSLIGDLVDSGLVPVLVNILAKTKTFANLIGTAPMYNEVSRISVYKVAKGCLVVQCETLQLISSIVSRDPHLRMSFVEDNSHSVINTLLTQNPPAWFSSWDASVGSLAVRKGILCLHINNILSAEQHLKTPNIVPADAQERACWCKFVLSSDAICDFLIWVIRRFDDFNFYGSHWSDLNTDSSVEVCVDFVNHIGHTRVVYDLWPWSTGPDVELDINLGNYHYYHLTSPASSSIVKSHIRSLVGFTVWDAILSELLGSYALSAAAEDAIAPSRLSKKNIYYVFMIFEKLFTHEWTQKWDPIFGQSNLPLCQLRFVDYITQLFKAADADDIFTIIHDFNVFAILLGEHHLMGFPDFSNHMKEIFVVRTDSRNGNILTSTWTQCKDPNDFLVFHWIYLHNNILDFLILLLKYSVYFQSEGSTVSLYLSCEDIMQVLVDFIASPDAAVPYNIVYQVARLLHCMGDIVASLTISLNDHFMLNQLVWLCENQCSADGLVNLEPSTISPVAPSETVEYMSIEQQEDDNRALVDTSALVDAHNVALRTKTRSRSNSGNSLGGDAGQASPRSINPDHAIITDHTSPPSTPVHGSSNSQTQQLEQKAADTTTASSSSSKSKASALPAYRNPFLFPARTTVLSLIALLTDVKPSVFSLMPPWIEAFLEFNLETSSTGSPLGPSSLAGYSNTAPTPTRTPRKEAQVESRSSSPMNNRSSTNMSPMISPRPSSSLATSPQLLNLSQVRVDEKGRTHVRARIKGFLLLLLDARTRAAGIYFLHVILVTCASEMARLSLLDDSGGGAGTGMKKSKISSSSGNIASGRDSRGNNVGKFTPSSSSSSSVPSASTSSSLSASFKTAGGGEVTNRMRRNALRTLTAEVIQGIFDIVSFSSKYPPRCDAASMAILCMRSLTWLLRSQRYLGLRVYVQEFFRRSASIAHLLFALTKCMRGFGVKESKSEFNLQFSSPPPASTQSSGVGSGSSGNRGRTSSAQLYNFSSSSSSTTGSPITKAICSMLLRQGLSLLTAIIADQAAYKTEFAMLSPASSSTNSLLDYSGAVLNSASSKPLKRASQQQLAPSANFEGIQPLVLGAERSPSRETIIVLFEMMLDCPCPFPGDTLSQLDENTGLFQTDEDKPKIKNIHVLPDLFNMIPYCSEENQTFILHSFLNLISGRASLVNLNSCAISKPRILDLALQNFQFLTDKQQVTNVSLIQCLGRHSISVSLLKHLYRVLHSRRSTRPAYSYRVIEALQGMIAEVNGPRQTFVFEGGSNNSSGLRLPPIYKWPSGTKNFSFCVWLRIEAPKFGRRHASMVDSPIATLSAPSKGVGIRRTASNTTAGSRYCPYVLCLRNNNGCGIELFLRATKRSSHFQVVLNYYDDKGELSQLAPEPRQMTVIEGKWHFLAISLSAQTMGFNSSKGEASVQLDENYVRNSFSFHGKLPEPLPEPIIGDCVSSLQETGFNTTLRGQMGALYFFSASLSEGQLRSVHALGPDYIYNFEPFSAVYRDISSMGHTHVKKQSVDPVLSILDGSLTEHIFLAYNPAVWLGEYFLDNTPVKNEVRWKINPAVTIESETLGADYSIDPVLLKTNNSPDNALGFYSMHALKLSGTYRSTTQDVRLALNSLGGIKTVFPLFAQLDEPRFANITAQQLLMGSQSTQPLDTTYDPNFFPAILDLVFTLVEGNFENQQALLKMSGFSIISFLLEKVSPEHFNANTFDKLVSIFNQLASNAPLQESLMDNIMCNFRLWVFTPFSLQYNLFDWLIATVRKYPQLLRCESLGFQRTLDSMLLMYDYKTPWMNSTTSVASTSSGSFDETRPANGAASGNHSGELSGINNNTSAAGTVGVQQSRRRTSLHLLSGVSAIACLSPAPFHSNPKKMLSFLKTSDVYVAEVLTKGENKTVIGKKLRNGPELKQIRSRLFLLVRLSLRYQGILLPEDVIALFGYAMETSSVTAKIEALEFILSLFLEKPPATSCSPGADTSSSHALPELLPADHTKYILLGISIGNCLQQLVNLMGHDSTQLRMLALTLYCQIVYQAMENRVLPDIPKESKFSNPQFLNQSIAAYFGTTVGIQQQQQRRRSDSGNSQESFAKHDWIGLFKRFQKKRSSGDSLEALQLGVGEMTTAFNAIQEQLLFKMGADHALSQRIQCKILTIAFQMTMFGEPCGYLFNEIVGIFEEESDIELTTLPETPASGSVLNSNNNNNSTSNNNTSSSSSGSSSSGSSSSAGQQRARVRSGDTDSEKSSPTHGNKSRSSSGSNNIFSSSSSSSKERYAFMPISEEECLSFEKRLSREYDDFVLGKLPEIIICAPPLLLTLLSLVSREEIPSDIRLQVVVNAKTAIMVNPRNCDGILLLTDWQDVIYRLLATEALVQQRIKEDISMKAPPPPPRPTSGDADTTTVPSADHKLNAAKPVPGTLSIDIQGSMKEALLVDLQKNLYKSEAVSESCLKILSDLHSHAVQSGRPTGAACIIRKSSVKGLKREMTPIEIIQGISRGDRQLGMAVLKDSLLKLRAFELPFVSGTEVVYLDVRKLSLVLLQSCVQALNSVQKAAAIKGLKSRALNDTNNKSSGSTALPPSPVLLPNTIAAEASTTDDVTGSRGASSGSSATSSSGKPSSSSFASHTTSKSHSLHVIPSSDLIQDHGEKVLHLNTWLFGTILLDLMINPSLLLEDDLRKTLCSPDKGMVSATLTLSPDTDSVAQLLEKVFQLIEPPNRDEFAVPAWMLGEKSFRVHSGIASSSLGAAATEARRAISHALLFNTGGGVLAADRSTIADTPERVYRENSISSGVSPFASNSTSPSFGGSGSGGVTGGRSGGPLRTTPIVRQNAPAASAAATAARSSSSSSNNSGMATTAGSANSIRVAATGGAVGAPGKRYVPSTVTAVRGENRFATSSPVPFTIADVEGTSITVAATASQIDPSTSTIPTSSANHMNYANMSIMKPISKPSIPISCAVGGMYWLLTRVLGSIIAHKIVHSAPGTDVMDSGNREQGTIVSTVTRLASVLDTVSSKNAEFYAFECLSVIACLSNAFSYSPHDVRAAIGGSGSSSSNSITTHLAATMKLIRARIEYVHAPSSSSSDGVHKQQQLSQRGVKQIDAISGALSLMVELCTIHFDLIIGLVTEELRALEIQDMERAASKDINLANTLAAAVEGSDLSIAGADSGLVEISMSYHREPDPELQLSPHTTGNTRVTFGGGGGTHRASMVFSSEDTLDRVSIFENPCLGDMLVPVPVQSLRDSIGRPPTFQSPPPPPYSSSSPNSSGSASSRSASTSTSVLRMPMSVFPNNTNNNTIEARTPHTSSADAASHIADVAAAATTASRHRSRSGSWGTTAAVTAAESSVVSQQNGLPFSTSATYRTAYRVRVPDLEEASTSAGAGTAMDSRCGDCNNDSDVAADAQWQPSANFIAVVDLVNLALRVGHAEHAAKRHCDPSSSSSSSDGKAQEKQQQQQQQPLLPPPPVVTPQLWQSIVDKIFCRADLLEETMLKMRLCEMGLKPETTSDVLQSQGGGSSALISPPVVESPSRPSLAKIGRANSSSEGKDAVVSSSSDRAGACGGITTGDRNCLPPRPTIGEAAHNSLCVPVSSGTIEWLQSCAKARYRLTDSFCARLREWHKSVELQNRRTDAKWTRIYGELANERGPWGSGARDKKEVFWMLDSTEINAGLKIRMRRNPSGSRHIAATQKSIGKDEPRDTSSPAAAAAARSGKVPMVSVAAGLYTVAENSNDEYGDSSVSIRDSKNPTSADAADADAAAMVDIIRDLKKYTTAVGATEAAAAAATATATAAASPMRNKNDDYSHEGLLAADLNQEVQRLILDDNNQDMCALDNEEEEEEDTDDPMSETALAAVTAVAANVIPGVETVLVSVPVEIITIATNSSGSKTEGRLELTKYKMSFIRSNDSEPYDFVNKTGNNEFMWACQCYPSSTWATDEIISAYERLYQFRRVAIEFFFSSRTSVFVNFLDVKPAKQFYLMLLSRFVRLPNLCNTFSGRPTVAILRPLPATHISAPGLTVTQAWVQHKITTFDYLLYLNLIAGRSFNNLSQYPVFPWVLSDYKSSRLDLRDPSMYRDFTLPMGAQLPNQRVQLDEKYEASASLCDDEILPYHTGSHYSSSAMVIWYLMRMEPFTSLHIWLQEGKFDRPDRLFHSIPSTWEGCTTNPQDVKELIPEFFCNPEFLENTNDIQLGRRQDGSRLDSVEMPAWCRDASDFVRIHRDALESDYVSKNIHHWIDLIFGYKQRPPHLVGGSQAAVEASNVFVHLTYVDAVNLEEIKASDIQLYNRTIRQIDSYGQTPNQLFVRSHPERQPFEKADIIWPICSVVPGVDTLPRGSTPLDKPTKVLCYGDFKVSNYPVLLMAECRSAERLVTVDTARLIGYHQFQVRQPDIVPPFIMKVDKHALSASTASMNMGSGSGGKRKLITAYLQYNSSGKEKMAGVPFASPGVLTQIQSTKHIASYLSDQNYALIGTPANKLTFIAAEMAARIKSQEESEKKAELARRNAARNKAATSASAIAGSSSSSNDHARGNDNRSAAASGYSPSAGDGSSSSTSRSGRGLSVVATPLSTTLSAAEAMPVTQKPFSNSSSSHNNGGSNDISPMRGTISRNRPDSVRHSRSAADSNGGGSPSRTTSSTTNTTTTRGRSDTTERPDRSSAASTPARTHTESDMSEETLRSGGIASSSKGAVISSSSSSSSSRSSGNRLPSRRERVDEHLSTNLFALLADSKLLFSCGHWDNSFKVTSVDTGRLIQSVSHHREVVTCLAVASDLGKHWLVTGSKDCIVCVWTLSPDRETDPINITPESVLYGHDDSVNCVAINPELDLVASGSDDGTVIIHTLRDGTYLRSIIIGVTQSMSNVLGANGGSSSSSNTSGSAEPFGSSSSSSRTPSRGKAISSPFNENGSGSGGSRGRSGSSASGSSRRSSSGGSSSSNRIADGGPQGHLKRRVHLLSISREGYVVAYSSDNNTLAVYGVNGKYIKAIDAKDAIYALCLSEDGRVVVTGGERGLVVFRWVSNLMIANNGPRKDLDSVVDGSNEQSHTPMQSPIRSLYFTAQERHLIVGLESGNIRVLAQDSEYLRRKLHRKLMEIGILTF